MNDQHKIIIAVLIATLVAFGGATMCKRESAFESYARTVCAQGKDACDDFFATVDSPRNDR